MTKMDEDQYDHDLVAMLEIFKRIDVVQFVTDLKVNQPETYERIRKIMDNEKYASTRQT